MLVLKHKYKRVIALVSDLHVGSRYAVFPERYSSEGGNDLSAMMNSGQKKILEYWNDFLRVCKDLKVDSVFLVGDATSGMNPKEFGLFMMTTDLDEQIEAAEVLLKPLFRGRKAAVWSGTPYHEALTTNIKVHKKIAEDLGATFMGPIANVRLKPTGRIANVTHKSSGAVIYPETAMGRDIMLFKEAEALGYIPKIDVIIRGHRHQWNYIHKNYLHYIQLPCWQAFVPYYGALRWYARYQPDIGGAILFIDDKDRIRVWHYLYPTVHIADRTRSG